MTAEEFRACLIAWGSSHAAAARRFGMSRSTIIGYACGRKKIPKVFELACRALSREMAAIDSPDAPAGKRPEERTVIAAGHVV